MSITPLGYKGITPLGRAVGGAAFSPSDISGLKLWLKADAGLYQDSAMTTPATANNDPVGGWADQSGQGNHATQATSGMRPALKAAIKNGLPVVRFDGADDFIGGAFPTGAARSIFIASRKRSAALSGLSVIMWSLGSTYDVIYCNETDAWGRGNPQGWLYYSNALSDASLLSGVSGNVTDWGILGLVSNSTPVITPYWNGAAMTPFSPKGSYASAATYMIANAAVGPYPGIDLDVLEICAYDSELSPGDITLLTAYLNTRWMIY